MTNYPGSVYVVVAALRAEDLPADSERKSEQKIKKNFAEFLPAAALPLGLRSVGSGSSVHFLDIISLRFL